MDHYAVFGNPIAQSKSPIIHQAFAKETNQQLSYSAILAAEQDFTDALEHFFSDPHAKGCNVTMPFKQQAAKWVDELSPAALIAGAVNTIIRQADGRFIGDTTDGVGLVTDLLAHGVDLNNSHILLLGAGGAARSVVGDLLQHHPKSLVICNRSVDKADTLAQIANDRRVKSTSYEQLNSDPQNNKFDLIINSTSTSLSGQLPAISESIIQHAHCVYDMVYQNEPTIFLQKAKQLGVQHTIDGLGMLIGQAAQSFYLWRGVKPKGVDLLTALRVEL